MKRIITYHNLTPRHMSTSDLHSQLEVNVTRLRLRTAVFALIALLALPVYPMASLFSAAVGALTGFWLWQNNRALSSELALRREEACA